MNLNLDQSGSSLVILNKKCLNKVRKACTEPANRTPLCVTNDVCFPLYNSQVNKLKVTSASSYPSGISTILANYISFRIGGYLNSTSWLDFTIQVTTHHQSPAERENSKHFASFQSSPDGEALLKHMALPAKNIAFVTSLKGPENLSAQLYIYGRITGYNIKEFTDLQRAENSSAAKLVISAPHKLLLSVKESMGIWRAIFRASVGEESVISTKIFPKSVRLVDLEASNISDNWHVKVVHDAHRHTKYVAESCQEKTDFSCQNFTSSPSDPFFVILQNKGHLGQSRFPWKDSSQQCKQIKGTLPVFRDKQDLSDVVSFLKFSDNLPTIEALYIGIVKVPEKVK